MRTKASSLHNARRNFQALFLDCITIDRIFIGHQGQRGGTSEIRANPGIWVWKGAAMSEVNQPPVSDAQKSRLPQALRQPLLDSSEAAAMLKIHPRTLQRLVHRGKIHAVQVGKLWRFKVSVIEAWIDR
jgi:excisionase family DNA binding protein